MAIIDLDKASYPFIHLQGQQLPFDETDVGKPVRITGTVQLKSIKYQGYNYEFELTQIEFEGRDIDKGTAKARKRKKEKRINIVSKPILDEGAAIPKKEEKYKRWLDRKPNA